MEKKLTLKKRGESVSLLEEAVPHDSIVTVGADPGATILLSDDDVAPEQFVLVYEEDRFVLMNHADGTAVNGESLSPGARIALNDGDCIGVGAYELFYGGPGVIHENKSQVQTTETRNGGHSAAGTAVAKAPEEFPAAAVSLESGQIAETVVGAADPDLSKLLYDLREEDAFYFHVHVEEGVIQRVPFESDEIWLGSKMGIATFDAKSEGLDEIFARINKDWSGVVIYPRDEQEILFNGERLSEPARLSNDDKLVLIDDKRGLEIQSTISFHEPVALIALHSILPGDLPEPVSSGFQKSISKHIDEAGENLSDAVIRTADRPRLMLGYFTLLDILIMTAGTIVTAAIIFFVLEFV